MSYYYLIASLPELDLNDVSLKIDVEEHLDIVFRNLSGGDREIARYIVLQNDNHNLINVLLEKFHDIPSTNPLIPCLIPTEEIKDYQNRLSDLPDYMSQFLIQNKGKLDLIRPSGIEETLLLNFYEEIENLSNDFLDDYFQFDRTIKQLATIHNLKTYELSSSSEFVNDQVNKELGLDRSKAILNKAYSYINDLWNAIEGKNPQQIELVMDSARWQFVSDYDPTDIFSNNNVFAWTMKLLLWSRWKGLSEEKGKVRRDELADQAIKESGIQELENYD